MIETILKEQYKSRIDELVKRLSKINIDMLNDDKERSTVEGCFAGTLTILNSVYGPNSAQVKSLFEIKKAFTKTSYSSEYELVSQAQARKGILQNTKEEIDSNLLKTISAETAGEVFGDFLLLAKAQLKNGYIPVARYCLPLLSKMH